MKILVSQPKISEIYLTNRVEDMDKIIWDVEDKVQDMNISAKGNVKSEKNPCSNHTRNLTLLKSKSSDNKKFGEANHPRENIRNK